MILKKIRIQVLEYISKTIICFALTGDRNSTRFFPLWTESFHLDGTKLRFRSAYHPNSNSQTEVVSRCLETYLRCKPKQGPKWLCWANNSASTQLNPFKALYSQDPPLLLKGTAIPSALEEINQMVAEHDALLAELCTNLLKAHNHMKSQADKHHRVVQYQVGEWVFHKLHPHYYGPFQIVNKKLPRLSKKRSCNLTSGLSHPIQSSMYPF